jgi:hypothetical protein
VRLPTDDGNHEWQTELAGARMKDSGVPPTLNQIGSAAVRAEGRCLGRSARVGYDGATELRLIRES